MVLANIVIYIPGLIWLDRWAEVMGFEFNTLDAGLWPFIPGDLAKLVAAALVLPACWTLVERVKGTDGTQR
jgi:biotin transport system substrate-specific component